MNRQHIPREIDVNFLLDPHCESRWTLARVVFLIALFLIVVILGSLKAAWWQIGVVVLLLWLVRFTSRWEYL